MKLQRILLGLVLLCVSSMSNAWWNADWKHREKVQLDTSASGADTKESLSGVAVALRLHTGNFVFADAKPDGSDLRFVAGDDKTVLKHYVERFDAANELATVWVLVPTLAPGVDKQSIWIYHGNPKAPVAEDAKSVFDSASVIFNFSAADGSVKDEGPNGLLPTLAPVKPNPAGLISGSAVFAGEPILLPDSAVLKHASDAPFTVSMWIKPGAAAKAVLWQQSGIEWAIDGSALQLKIKGAEAAKGGQIKPEVWQHVALVASSGKATLYLDGVEVGASAASLPDVAGEVRIGAGFQGEMDALQLSGSARSADWLKLVVKGQGAEASFGAVSAEGGEEAEEGGGQNYFGILVGNLTTDAWVVIIILAIMFVVAVGVMVGKAVFISRTDSANRRFLERFRAAADDFVALPKQVAFNDSSLHRLYEAGVRELRKRFAGRGENEAHPGLSGATIDAIKASIDADLVRETHRLNAQMVLLTIAISGGPFLGLLGTVVGVMITFAAIAAAGDVNVNAIAPGIAAALLATVAGLSVAIPALFGYNYLASRIKNISADMQIFVDEFVTRVAERYGAR